MFTFNGDEATKIVALSSISISPEHKCEPLVWTKGLQEITSPRVFLLFNKTRAGRNQIRVYPLEKKGHFAPPVFTIVAPDDKIAETSHICLEHALFKIVRPLEAVFQQAQWAIVKRDIDYIPKNLLTLLKHLYFKDLVIDSLIDEYAKEFQKIDKLMKRAYSSRFEGEVDVCLRKSLQLCEKLFHKLKEVYDEVSSQN